MLDRYNVTSMSDLEEAARKIENSYRSATLSADTSTEEKTENEAKPNSDNTKRARSSAVRAVDS
jgi:hypothetical protein